MTKLYEDFSITGVANDTVYDDGIESTDVEKKRVIALLLNVSGYAGNIIEYWLERERKGKIPDYLLDTDANSGGTNTLYSTIKINRIEVNLDIPVGQRFKVAIRCGATAKNLRGCYEYEII